MNVWRRSVVALVALPAALAAQGNDTPAKGPIRGHLPVGLQVAFPTGEFAEHVDVAGGLAGGIVWPLSGQLAVRADLGFMIYGSERRRVPLGTGPLGRITVDVNTTNAIFAGGIGLQLGTPSTEIWRPYVGGTLGFANFSTSSSVEGTNNDNDPFASSTNYSDGVFSKNLLAGLYIPINRGKVMLDIGVRGTWNGEEVRYLKEGSIVDDPNGTPRITPVRTRADYLSLMLGLSIPIR